jgi:hypothetical protein
LKEKIRSDYLSLIGKIQLQNEEHKNNSFFRNDLRAYEESPIENSCQEKKSFHKKLTGSNKIKTKKRRRSLSDVVA